MQKSAKCLDGGDHAGRHVLPAEQPANFGLEACLDARAQLAQELSIEAGVQQQTFGDGQHDLPVRDGSTHVFGHPLALAKGAGAEMRITLGVAVVAGMLGVTYFGLVFTPVFYSTIMWFGGTKRPAALAQHGEPH